MNLVVRRRLAAGAIISSSAVVAGLLLAPDSSASANGLSFSPSGAVTGTTAKVAVQGSDADFEYGGTLSFARVGGGQPFTGTVDGPTTTGTPPTGTNHKGSATINLADQADGVGADGPIDSGDYNATATGATQPNPIFPGGGTDSCQTCFTVLPAGPVAVTSVAPSSIRPGQSNNNFTVIGNNFERGVTIQFLFADGNVDPLITANTAPKDSSGDVTKGITTRTQIKRTAKVDANDQPGQRGMRISNLDGNSYTCTACFFVAGPPLTSIQPSSGLNDPGRAPVTVTMTGTNVVNGTPRLEFVGNPGSATKDALSLDPVSKTQSTGQSISGVFDLQNAAPGPYQAVVRDAATGITNACEQPGCSQFTVIQSNRVPTVTGLDRDPNTAGNQKDQQVGSTQVFNVAGTNFSKGVAIKVFNTGTTTATTGVTVTNVEFVSPTQVKATFVADKAATPGDYDITATLTDGSTSAVCSKCYTLTAASSPSPSASSSASSSPCPTTSASPSSASPSSTGSASPTATASSTTSGTPSATASSTTSGSPTATASSTTSSSPSATSTASISPSPRSSGCPSPSQSANRQQATLTVEDDTIPAGSKAHLFATGAPNQAYSLQCYTRPSVQYSEARSGTFDSAGNTPTFELNLGRNTRCYVRYVTNPTQGASEQVVINVNTVLSLSAIRKGTRTYEFRGRNLPRVPGQLITLYRVDNTGKEIRTSNLKTDSSGIYTVTRKFTGNGTFHFLVRTSKTNDNAPGHSNTITTNIH